MKYFVTIIVLLAVFSVISIENAFGEKCLPIELEYKINGGVVTELCKSDINIQVNAKIQASENGYLNIEIPTKVVYSLDGLNCELGNLFVLMDGHEIIPDNTISDNTKNIITVSFHDDGNHTIAFVGSTILPDPGPSDYCGIVMGYDSLYLPPKFQEKNGVTLKHIHCNENLKVLERFDGSTACVDYDTRTKLIQRGWGINSLYQLDDKTIIENVKDLEEVKAFLAKYPNSGYGIDRDSWQVYLLVHGILPDESSFSQQRTKKMLVEIDPFGRPLWVGIECGGPFTLSAQTNVIELLNTPNWCFPDGNEISDKVPFGIEIQKPKNLTMEVISSDWCSGLSLDKIPPNGLTKRNDWFGANALIMTIVDAELNQVPHLQEMINEMKNTTGFKPHEFDKNVMVKQITGSGVDHSKIFDWLKENFEKQYATRMDGSFSSFFQYNGDIYAIKFTQC